MCYDKVKSGIHALIFAQMTANTDVREGIKFLLEETDHFHSDAFHEVKLDYEHDDNLDTLFDAYEEVRECILEYYAEPMNFTPGYLLPHIAIKELNNVPDGEFEKLLESLSS